MRDAQLNHRTGPSSNQRVWHRAWRSSRPTCARLESRPPTRGKRTEVHLVGCAGTDPRVRSLGVVPGDVLVELATECGARHGHDGQEPRALVFQRTDEPLDHGEAAVLADGAESLLDAATAAPRVEVLRRELRAVVRDEVAGAFTESAAHSA